MRTEYRDASGNTWMVVHLWQEPLECNMCGDLGDHKHAVPWYCGPVLEGCSEGGYKVVCKRCHDKWAAWSDSISPGIVGAI